MRNLFKFIHILLLMIVLQSLTGCRGCSPSGVKSKARSRNTDRNVTVYPKNESVEKQNDNKEKTQQSFNPLKELFQKYQPAVFMVFTSDAEYEYQGTGFFISSDGIAVSNYHVFKGTTKGKELIRTVNGHKLKIERVIAQSEDNDYIVFKVRLNNAVRFTPIPIAKQNPEIGEDVFAIGNPYGLEHTLSKGIVSGFRSNNSLIQTTTEITHGSSGGPLLNMEGEVVGITTAGLGDANLNFAVNIQVLHLKSILTTQQVSFKPGQSYFAQVSRVIDGDTFVIESGQRVRLIGMDCPETQHPRKGKEPLGEEATIFTRKLIDEKIVRLEMDVGLYDRYKRLLAYVYVDDIFINDVLLKVGLARVTTFPPNVKYVEQFMESQEKAKEQKLGIWSDNL